MSLQQSDTWQWWLQYGFDGIAGGVLGGLVTGGAVWLTIRHERKIRMEDKREADRVELHAAVGRLRREMNRLRFGFPGSNSSMEATIWIRRIEEEVAAALAAVHSGDRTLFADLEMALVALESCTEEGPKHTHVDRPRAIEVCGAVIRGVHEWQLDPDAYDGWMGRAFSKIDAKQAPASEESAG